MSVLESHPAEGVPAPDAMMGVPMPVPSQCLRWREIAFPVVKITLEHYFRDATKHHFPARMFDITREGRQIDCRLVSQSG